MKYNQLELKRQKPANRVGRGIAGGQGKTAGRGTKGQGARKSPGRAGFEGGQTPLALRLPKLRGFKSLQPKMINVYTGQLNQVKSSVIDNEALAKAGLVPSAYEPVKLILNGDVSSKFTVKLQSASAGAVKAVQKAGGSFEKVARVGRLKTSAKSKAEA